MGLRKRHGASKALYGALVPDLEKCPIDELPDGIPDDPARNHDPQTGRFLPGNALARAGGLAKGEYRAQAARLGLAELPASSALAPYRNAARDWRDATAVDMARTVGGGTLGPMVHALLEHAAHSLLWARYVEDRALATDDSKLALEAAKHADNHSEFARHAWEYAAKDASRREEDPADVVRRARLSHK